MDPVLPLDIIDMIAQKCVGPFTISVTLSRLTLPSTSKLRVQRIPPAPLRLRDVCKAFDRGVLLGLRDQFDRHLRIAPNSFKETAIYRATMASSSSKCRGNWLYRPPHGSETGLQVSSYNREHHTLAAPYAMDNPNEVQLRGSMSWPLRVCDGPRSRNMLPYAEKRVGSVDNELPSGYSDHPCPRSQPKLRYSPSNMAQDLD